MTTEVTWRMNAKIKGDCWYLGRILASGSSHQGKTSQGHDALHKGLARAQGVVEELAHWQGEVQAASKHRHHLELPSRYAQTPVQGGDTSTDFRAKL